MTQLELPKELNDHWERALFMSFGADFPFFESTLWNQLGERCRQKVILLDGGQYLNASALHAEDRLARHLNHRYVAAGVFHRHAVHAKLILLTTPERGRLFVGSGNLNWQGYASGGEMFSLYKWDEANGGELAAFASARELLEGLMAARAIDPVATGQVRQLLDQTPWLYRPVSEVWRPVRHNLTESFQQQLSAVVDGEPVDELWVLSPFYDEAAEGLRQLLLSLRPRETHLLVQPGRTSVDPVALSHVIDGWGGAVHVRPVTKSEQPYLHAKLYLVKSGRRAICLQGSANLSKVAMLRTVRDGNVEVVNLLEGERDTFDYLLAELDIGDAVDPQALSLALQADESKPEPPTAAPFYLTGGEWDGRSLALHFRGALPDLTDCRLEIGAEVAPAVPVRSEGNRLYLEVGDVYHHLFNETVAVRLTWAAGAATALSNPVFLYHRADLQAELQVRAEGEHFSGMGDLDIDEDLEQLVADLENALIVDRRSVWRLAGKRGETQKASDEALDATPLSYGTIDYDALRSHPKTQQYLRRGAGHELDGRSRVQIILGVITGRIDEIADLLRDPALAATRKEALGVDGAETEEEREAEEAERECKRRDKGQRLRQILKRFIGRYLNGFEKSDFQQAVGYEVLTQNYIIFDHLLWELGFRDYFQSEIGFLVAAQLRIWELFWGTGNRMGYVSTLSDKDRAVALGWLREGKADARLLAAVWRAAELLGETSQPDCLRLRALWRHLLLTPPFPLDEERLTYMWVIAAQTNMLNPPTAAALVEDLRSLADTMMDSEFHRSIEKEFGFPEGSCQFELRKEQKTVNFKKVMIDRRDLCVRLSNDNITPDIGRKLLAHWMRYAQLDGYRISFGRPHDKLKVVLSDQEGVIFWDETSGLEVLLNDMRPVSLPWDALLEECGFIAAQMVWPLLPPTAVSAPLHLPHTHS